jgi:hypothetical protein
MKNHTPDLGQDGRGRQSEVQSLRSKLGERSGPEAGGRESCLEPVNQKLRAVRDLLLRRLMSGELAV